MRSLFSLHVSCAAFLLTFGGVQAQAAEVETCQLVSPPTVSLNFESRYADDSLTRSDIDPVRETAVEAALKPLDDFIRRLAREANDVTRRGAGAAESARCVSELLAQWAEADSLSVLASPTARLTIGSRLTGIAMAYLQVKPLLETQPDDFEAWLSTRMQEQMHYWEEDAFPGAKRGNLRAWATLGIIAAGIALEDDVMLRWGSWSTVYLLCTANGSGALPREMERGHLALHYQMHAINPLVLSVRLLEGADVSTLDVCDGALKRIVRFAYSEFRTEGAISEKITGEPQSFFTGRGKLKAHQMAFAPAYLSMVESDEVSNWARSFEHLSNSKLGGDQVLLWLPDGLGDAP